MPRRRMFHVEHTTEQPTKLSRSAATVQQQLDDSLARTLPDMDSANLFRCWPYIIMTKEAAPIGLVGVQETGLEHIGI
jgi:hypothetical protein